MNGSNGFNYNFGIAIARGTVRDLALLSGATLSVTAAIYGLITTANTYDETLKRSRLAFGGYTNAINAMAFSQQKLLDGKSYFNTDDIMEGMSSLQQLGVDAKKNFDLINNMANLSGKTFTETGSSIAAAMRGDVNALRDFGIPEQAMKQFDKFQGNTTLMRNAVLGFLKNQKMFRKGMDETLITLPMYFARMKGFATLFAEAILGKPTDPNGLLNSFKHTLNSINEFLKEHQKTIARTGAYIGMMLKFIFKSVGQFIKWVFSGAGDAVKRLDKFMDNYTHNIMSIMLFLELAKGKVVALFQEYQGAIITVLKIFAVFKAAQLALALTSFVLATLRSGWDKVAYGIKYARVMTNLFTHSMNKVGRAVTEFAQYSWYEVQGLYRRWIIYMGVLKQRASATMQSLKNGLQTVQMWTRATVAQFRLMASRAYWSGLQTRAVASLAAMRAALISGMTAAWSYVASLYATATAAITGIVPALTAAAASAWAFAAAMLANPMTWIVLGVAALAVGLFMVLRYFYGTKAVVGNLIDLAIVMVAAFFPIVGVVFLLIRYWSKFKVIFINTWHTVTNVAKLAWLKMKAPVSEFLDWISSKFSVLGKIFDPITAMFKNVTNWVKGLGDGFLGKLLDKVINLTGSLTSATGEALALEQKRQGLQVTANYGQSAPVSSVASPVKATPATGATAQRPVQKSYMDMGRGMATNARSAMTGGENGPPESMPTPDATTINVYAAPGQNAEQIAQEVMRRIESKKRTTAQRQGTNP